jgi:hypothetical protein
MIANPATAIELTEEEFVVCWRALGLGELPLVLGLRPLGASTTDRQRLHTKTMTELQRRHLAAHDEPNASLSELLHLLAKSTHELDIRLASGPRGMIVGLGAIRGAQGVLVIAAPGAPLRLKPLDATRIASALLELAGPITPGHGRAVNIPAHTLDDACEAAGDGNLWTLADQLTVRAVPRLDAASLAHMCTGIREIGQLGATNRVNGTPQRAPWVVGFHRGDTGHFLQLRRPTNPTGDETVTIGPTTAHRLMRQLNELHNHVRSATQAQEWA